MKTSARNPLSTLEVGRDPSPEVNNLIIDTVKINVEQSPDVYNDVLSVKEMLESDEIKESIFDNIY